MKNILRSFVYIQMAALLLTAVLGAAPREKSIHGDIYSWESAEFAGTTMFVEGTGSGVATHLGKFTYTYVFEVDLLTGDGIGAAHFVAANGDSFSTTITAVTGPNTTPDVANVIETHTIVEGTGRFAGASGSLTLDRLFVFATSLSVGTIEGEITLPTGK
jgi:hypothetical protein